MESKFSHIDAKESETCDKISSNLNETDTSSFDKDYCTSLRSYLKPSLELDKTERISNRLRPKAKKRIMNHRTSKILKRRSLSPDVSISDVSVQSNAESSSFPDRKIDSYERVSQKDGVINMMERLSPIPQIHSAELNESTLCPNDLSNDSNMCSDTGINGSVYSDNDLHSQNLYTDTGMTGSQLINDSQIFNNTTLGVNMDLNIPNNPGLGGMNNSSSQGFNLLQNMHYDQNNTNQNLNNSNNFLSSVNALNECTNDEMDMNQVDQYRGSYMFQYGSNTRTENRDQYMQYNEGMEYVDNVDYMLDDGIDYVMDSNYTQDNTNLASHNFDSNSVFINMDNATQSQEQLSLHTVNFNASNNADELVMEDMGNDADKEMIRNNSINVLIENSDKKFDEGVMSSILRDLICPICLEYFYFPVTVACGHTFCRYCIGHSKLSGKMCPLCRQPIGRSLNINTILSNLVKSLKLRKRGHATLLRVPDVSHVAEKVWWDEHCLKPYVSVPLFIRIMFGGMTQAPVFFDDLCSCLIDYFDSGKRWYKSKWVFTIEDFRLMRNLIGLQLNAPDKTQSIDSDAGGSGDTVNETNSIRLHHWVEDYLIANPQLCFRSDVMYPLTLKVYHDVNHKIEGTIFSALDIPYKLPWDAGRHVKSLLHLPHSSVSLSHLIFAPCPNGQFGILDVGSTIGTMIKIQGVHVLQSGDRIHIGDKHEVDVHIYKDSIGTPFKDYKWDASTNQVINYSEYMSNHASQNEGNGEQVSMENVSSQENIDSERNSNLYELDSFLKLRIFADLQVERDVWICPKGVILGRGPVTQSSYKKLSITTQNGYISREHCLIYYDGSRPSGSRWLLRDMSTLGTFLKLKPFQDPLPVAPGFVFKVGQCKVEVGSPHELSRRVPSSATLILSQLLQSHIEPFRLVEIPSNLPNVPNNQQANVNANNFTNTGNPAAQGSSVVELNGFDASNRFQPESMNRFEASQGVGDDVDPNGQIVPDVLRDVVL